MKKAIEKAFQPVDIAEQIYAELEDGARVDGVTFDDEQSGYIKQALSDAVMEVRQRVFAALSAPPADAWQPIETAPKDGRWILVWGPQMSDPDITKWFDDIRAFDPSNVTHWMPLPAPPADQQQNRHDPESRMDTTGDSTDSRTAKTNEPTPALVDYMTATTREARSAAFLRTYAARVRDGSAMSWEIPNTVASTLEDIATFLETPRPAPDVITPTSTVDYQGSCGYAMYGPPALCTCGTCEDPAGKKNERC